MIWRIILNGVATFQEIDSYWNINTVMDANEALDIKEEAEEFYRKEAERSRTNK